MSSLRIFIVLALLIIIFNLFPSFDATEIITQTRFISDSKNEALISSNGNFKLGFFSPGKSAARYVGIWFNKISKQTVVWVANRQIPLQNSNGVFKIGKDGNLAVFNGNEATLVWSTNVSMSTNTSSATAKLLPSGNLVLVVKNGSGNDDETIIWQSFDHPTDTLLPGMTFGLNFKSSLKLVLTSWKSSDDPAVGDFSYFLDPQGSPQFFLYKNTDPSWRCGPWNGRTMSGVPNADDPNVIDVINYTPEFNADGISITFSLVNESNPSIFVLEPLGTMQQLVWYEDTSPKTWTRLWMAPTELCEEYARCGTSAICDSDNAVWCTCLPGFKPLSPRGWLINCVEKKKVERCGKGDGEGFVKFESVKVPDARFSKVYVNMSLKECERECLKSCNCTGYATIDATDQSGGGCITWFGKLTDMSKYKTGQDFYLRVDAKDLAAANERKNSKQFVAKRSTIGFIIVPVAMEVLLIAACFYLWRRHAKRRGLKKKQLRRNISLLDSVTSLSDHEDPQANSSGESKNIELTLFKLSTMIAATDSFSSAKKLGQGGFGPVYKGRLRNGQEIAIKRLSKNSGQGIEEFKNEVSLIAKLQHRNLVRLLGCCIEEDEKMLVYEFMPNKSLDYFIFDESRKLLLDWERRFDIILGIARGILYLHQDSRLRIIHRDLKASNILLDGEMKPKISDFGTARIFGEDQTQGNTNRVVGTYGYMSPEYAVGGHFSVKSDVFSFGVLLLEIISGKKNTSLFNDDPSSNLIRYTWELWRDDKALEIVDSTISNSCPANEVLRCIQVGLLCVQDYTRDRPTMSSVVFMLSNETTLPSPKQSTFAIRRFKDKPDSSISGTRSSINEVTITTCIAR